jgi:hypothetical protein
MNHGNSGQGFVPDASDKNQITEHSDSEQGFVTSTTAVELGHLDGKERRSTRHRKKVK